MFRISPGGRKKFESWTIVGGKSIASVLGSAVVGLAMLFGVLLKLSDIGS